MSNPIEIFVDDVNDVEARVYARYVGAASKQIVLRGTLRGPYCETTHTLPAEFAFCNTGRVAEAVAVVPDPCTWSPELPHLYRADVEAVQGDRVTAEYRGLIGLRKV
jgi:beta-galactosidase/beta-glucuronidase